MVDLYKHSFELNIVWGLYQDMIDFLILCCLLIVIKFQYGFFCSKHSSEVPKIIIYGHKVLILKNFNYIKGFPNVIER